MGLRISTNVASLMTQRSLSKTSKDLEVSMKQLASGSRFADPRESSAELGISEHLRGQAAGLRAATRNAETADSFAQIAEGGLSEQNNILIRMRELAIQSASDSFGSQERQLLQEEFSELAKEFDRIAQSTRFGDQKLLAGDNKSYEFQVGANQGAENIVSYNLKANTTASELNIDGLSVSDKSDARDALDDIDKALNSLAQARAGFGALQSRMESVVNHASSQAIAVEEARSRMADTDVAQAVSQMYRSQALQQYQISVLTEANSYPGKILRLIA